MAETQNVPKLSWVSGESMGVFHLEKLSSARAAQSYFVALCEQADYVHFIHSEIPDERKCIKCLEIAASLVFLGRSEEVTGDLKFGESGLSITQQHSSGLANAGVPDAECESGAGESGSGNATPDLAQSKGQRTSPVQVSEVASMANGVQGEPATRMAMATPIQPLRTPTGDTAAPLPQEGPLGQHRHLETFCYFTCKCGRYGTEQCDTCKLCPKCCTKVASEKLGRDVADDPSGLLHFENGHPRNQVGNVGGIAEPHLQAEVTNLPAGTRGVDAGEKPSPVGPVEKFGECGELPLGANAAVSMPSGKEIDTPPLRNEHSPIHSFPICDDCESPIRCEMRGHCLKHISPSAITSGENQSESTLPGGDSLLDLFPEVTRVNEKLSRLPIFRNETAAGASPYFPRPSIVRSAEEVAALQPCAICELPEEKLYEVSDGSKLCGKCYDEYRETDDSETRREQISSMGRWKQ